MNSYKNLNSKIKEENFAEKVLKVVAKIERGRVLTYKEVATLAGNHKASRAVGAI